MALPRFDKLPEERRLQLISAAALEFAASGFRGAVLEAIADKAGIGKSSFYYYFSDKADLFTTVLEEAWKKLNPRSRIDLEALDQSCYWTAIEDLARDNLELCSGEPWLIEAAKLLNRAFLDPSAGAVLETFLDKRKAWERDWVARGQELGAVRGDLPADLLATIALGARQASNIWLLDRMETEGLERTNQLALKVFEIQRTLLAPPVD